MQNRHILQKLKFVVNVLINLHTIFFLVKSRTFGLIRRRDKADMFYSFYDIRLPMRVHTSVWRRFWRQNTQTGIKSQRQA